MAYHDLAALSDDQGFLRRCAAARVTQPDLDPTEDPMGWVLARRWALAASPGFADEYASALAAGIASPGEREDVIPDLQILAAVQALAVAPPDLPDVPPTDQ